MLTQTILRTPFTATAAALERVISQIERVQSETGDSKQGEFGDVLDDAPVGILGGLPNAKERRAAYARYASAKANLPPSDEERVWSAGSMTIAVRSIDAADDSPSGAALAASNSGGIMHLGAIRIMPSSTRAAAATQAGVTITTTLPSGAWFQKRFAAAMRDPFIALSRAFANCTIAVEIAADTVVSDPIQLVFAYPEGTVQAVFPTITVHARRGAKAVVIERHVGEGEALVVGSVTAKVDEQASLSYVAVQRVDDRSTVRIARSGACGANATLNWHIADFGGAYITSRSELDLAGDGATGSATFLTMGTEKQRVDHTIRIDHRVPSTKSKSTACYALMDRARVGHQSLTRIRGGASPVHASITSEAAKTSVSNNSAADSSVPAEIKAEAIGTDAEGVASDAITNVEALLLSPKTRLDLRPNRVAEGKTLHARQRAKIGSLAEDDIFYLNTRGITRSEALRLVTLAFFEPAITTFPGELLRDEIRTALDDNLELALLRDTRAEIRS